MDFKILGSLGKLPVAQKSGVTGEDTGTESFGAMVGKAVESVMESHKTAEQMSVAVANGEDIPMHKVIQAVSEAELMLETMVTVRDRAVEAYQQIQQMPI